MTINDLLTFLRRFRSHVYFRFSAVPDEPARIIAGQITGNPDPVKILPRVPQFRIRDPPE